MTMRRLTTSLKGFEDVLPFMSMWAAVLWCRIRQTHFLDFLFSWATSVKCPKVTQIYVVYKLEEDVE